MAREEGAIIPCEIALGKGRTGAIGVNKVQDAVVVVLIGGAAFGTGALKVCEEVFEIEDSPTTWGSPGGDLVAKDGLTIRGDVVGK